jgi:heptosyltransferase-2
MVMAQSLFRVLKTRQPPPAIDVLAPAWSQPLLARMPEVRRSIPSSVGRGELKLGIRYRLGRSLRSGNYRQAIVLPNSFKSALIPFWASIPLRTGYLGEFRYGLLNDARTLNKTALPMTVQRFVALGSPVNKPLPEPLPFPELIVRQTDVDSALQRLQLTRPGQPLLILCPGAEYGEAKRWPPGYFAEVARDRIAAGWKVWILGSQNDAAAAAEVDAATGKGCVNLAGKTRLEEAIDLMSLATAVVTNDSGLMHVAAALQRPLIAIFGSSSPDFTPPLSDHATVLTLRLECSPCFERECPLGHLKCLRDLEPERVLRKLETLID